MARDGSSNDTPSATVISIIGPDMKVIGDCETEATVRVDGLVEGSIRAANKVVIGKGGVVIGDVATQEAVVAGRVFGTLIAGSRIELQATCQLQGEIHTNRMQVQEGAVLNCSVHMPGKAGPQASRSEGEQKRRVVSIAQQKVSVSHQ